MRFLAVLFFMLSVVPAYAAAIEIKAASVAYVEREIDLLWDAVDESVTAKEVADTYATKQDVEDAIKGIDTTNLITTNGGNIEGVLNVPTPSLPTGEE
ncbi:MAG: hypothetical protein J6R22_03305 [Alphaproteobacteria bacterium]|nr:hypothetical protein [Alphaproteobacteria bacterium]